jgi:GNAT superfamily N-acetyltransferase
VQPEWFRRGAGRALMSDLEGWLRIRGAAGVHRQHPQWRGFYRHLGYCDSAPPASDQGLHRVTLYKPLALPG